MGAVFRVNSSRHSYPCAELLDWNEDVSSNLLGRSVAVTASHTLTIENLTLPWPPLRRMC